MDAPFVVKIVVSLTFLIIFYRITKSFLWSIVMTTIGFAGWLGFSFQEMGMISFRRAVSPNHLFLSLTVLQVIWLSNQMNATGMMQKFILFFKSRFSSRTSFALLPAVVGLLPMPGGAIFSAPLVQANDSDLSMDPELKTRINYWFRHIWEYWWPLYPGVILAMEITRMRIGEYIFLLFPFTVFTVIVGRIFILSKIPQNTGTITPDPPPAPNGDKSFDFPGTPFLPIVAIIITYILIQMLLPGWATFNKYIPMVVGLLSAQILLQIISPIGWKELLKAGFALKTFSLIIIVTAIRIYGAFLEPQIMGGSPFSVMDHVHAELQHWNISPLWIVAFIPFMAGITTGLAIGFVGAGFPVVISLLGQNPSAGDLYFYTTLAYGFGYMGMMLSPVHVCLIVTAEYFKTSLYGTLKKLIPLAISMMGFSLTYSFLIRFIMKA